MIKFDLTSYEDLLALKKSKDLLLFAHFSMLAIGMLKAEIKVYKLAMSYQDVAPCCLTFYSSDQSLFFLNSKFSLF